MAYNIKKTNGQPLFGEVGLPENEVDTSKTSLALIGKLTPDYGNYQSENFLHLMEHFANDIFPTNPLKGQIVYNTADKCLYVCSNDVGDIIWTKLMIISFEKSDSAQNGDMYYDINDKKLYIYDEEVDDWILIGPDNYRNKKKISTVLKSSSEASKAHFDFDIDSETTNLVTIKAVAREQMSTANQFYSVRRPESAAWVYRMVVSSYKQGNAIISSIIGNPNYELIGRTDGEALKWTITPTINDDKRKLSIIVDGVGTANTLVKPEDDWVEWELDIEIVKV